jgi:hypothetical protein
MKKLAFSLIILSSSLGLGLGSPINNDPFKNIKEIEKKAYEKGLKDAFKFIRLQYFAEIPPKGFWVIKDVTDKDTEEIAIYYLFARQKGFNPVLLFNKANGRLYLVITSETSQREALKDLKSLKPMKAFILPIKEPSGFQKAVYYKICRTNKPKKTLSGAIELIEGAEAILLKNYSDILDTKKVKKDFEKAIRDLESIKNKMINTKEALEKNTTQ